MTAKDYVYLGLIALTALAFYHNGFRAGVYRCRRIYEKVIDEQEGGDKVEFAETIDHKNDKFEVDFFGQVHKPKITLTDRISCSKPYNN